MRVLQLNISYRGTGADRCARELYEELPRLGIETQMWVGAPSSKIPQGVKSLQNSWERWLTPLEALPDLTDWRHRGSIASLKSITKDSFDLVHIHNIHSGWISIKAVRELAARFPCVWTLHDEWAPKGGLTYDLTGKVTEREVKNLSRGLISAVPYNRYHENFKWRRTRRFLDTFMPVPKAVICPSVYISDLAKSSGRFPSSEIVHIPNGTKMPSEPAVKMDRKEARRSLGLQPDQPVVLMISADLSQAHKGIDLGIKAIQSANASKRIQTLLVGTAGEQIVDALRPVPTTTIFAADDLTLARAYRAADVTIIPSLGENYPYVGLESLACGTPLLSFAIGGLPEIIGDNERGVVCSNLSPVEMGRNLSYLILNPMERQQMGDRGVNWVNDVCGMDKYLAAIKAVYDRAVG